ncbi:hypothetical protein [Crystallibacter degradans]|uniref:hypothetical protein n=1 Tax=Crystallibacter degradans TaxID=2726743 RepID=UPI0014741E81|nr:hypothetical protein [Arthrobacter sp. SF27]NMR28124.1 hypothetical protein [Arthrobacter sp. SF27]
MSRTRLDNCTGSAVLIASTFGADVQIIASIQVQIGSVVTDNRATRNPQRVYSDLQIDGAIQGRVLADTAAMLSGKSYASFCTNNPSTFLFGDGGLRMGRLVVGRSCTLNSISPEVTTAGGAGAVLRLGIYRLNYETGVSTLLLDAGTVDASTTGVKTLAINSAVKAGDQLLLAAASQGAASPAPTIRTNTGSDPYWGVDTATMSVAILIGAQVSGMTGALPASPPLGVVSSGGVPRLIVGVV